MDTVGLTADQQEWVRDYEWQEPHEEQEKMKWQDNGGGDFEQPPVGSFVGRCVRVIDIGTQRGEYQGKATSRRQCIIGWELPTELMAEGDLAGKPFIVSKFYTASLGEKANLRKDLENWRGRSFTEQELKGFESKSIITKLCMLSLTANDKGKTRVTGVMAMPKGMEVPAQAVPDVYFSLDEFNADVFETLSDGIKKMITTSPEYQGAVNRKQGGAKSTMADMEDDVPF